MIKKWTVLILALVMAAAFCMPASANPANTFYKLGFTKSRPVYTGPGYSYYRANGNAEYGGGGAQYYGTDTATGWLLIGYRTGKGLWRMGYVTPDSESLIRPTDSYALFDITFEYTPAHTSESCIITDDPMMDLHTPLATLPTGHNVTVLCAWNSGWTYVETVVQGLGTMRGYVRPSNLAPGEAAYQEPAAPPEGTWQTLYRSYLQTHYFEDIYDLELIDIDFNGTPELLISIYYGAHGYDHTLLCEVNGSMYTDDYYPSYGGNMFWDTIRYTNSFLYLYYDQQAGRYIWLNIGGDASTGMDYGNVSEISLSGGTLMSNSIFEYAIPTPDNLYGEAEYTVQSNQTNYNTFISMLDYYKGMHSLYTTYVPCYQEAFSYNAVSVFNSLADIYNNYTRYLLP